MKIPKGWSKVASGEPVFHNYLEWNNGWHQVTKFGSFWESCDKKGVIKPDVPNGDLMMAIRKFPYPIYLWNRSHHSKGELFARIMYLAGAEEISLDYQCFYGDKTSNSLKVHDQSFTIKPYIELPFTKGSLHYFLLKKIKIPYCGMASDDTGKSYSQSSWIDKEGFIQDAINYFAALKSFDKRRK